ncbi:MipA/OmpV family protein [Aerophototrophica crusticola]|uniref:MipA/OmpV family protein n=1 Tax=Aerophototrophica crusticola TaxID=1709002 RepID=A0A858R7U6_9PROT|nr:MipA/OmpV family protein [Rhodospirillaceae bacterium B3]
MSFSLRAPAALALLAGLTLPAPALAQGGPPPKEGWNARVGLLGLVLPEYEGADEYEVKPVPDLEITYGETFFLDRRGLGVNVLNTRSLTAGVSLNYDGGREENDNDALRGLGDVDGTMVGTAFAEYRIGQVGLGLDVTGDLLGDGHDGVTATVSAIYQARPTDDLMLFAGPSATWASKDYMRSYFGITPAQAERSGRPVYETDSGFKDVAFTVFGIYSLTEDWALTGIAGYKRLLGDAKDSPIVDRDGSADQFFGGLGVSYSF